MLCKNELVFVLSRPFLEHSVRFPEKTGLSPKNLDSLETIWMHLVKLFCDGFFDLWPMGGSTVQRSLSSLLLSWITSAFIVRLEWNSGWVRTVVCIIYTKNQGACVKDALAVGPKIKIFKLWGREEVCQNYKTNFIWVRYRKLFIINVNWHLIVPRATIWYSHPILT